jgi:hypothetical protein
MPAPEGGKTEGLRDAGSHCQDLEPIPGISYTHNPQKELTCISRCTSFHANPGKILNPSELALLNRKITVSAHLLPATETNILNKRTHSLNRRASIPYTPRSPPGKHPSVLTGGQREPKGGAVVRREDGGAQAEVAERHAGNRGEGEDTEEREGTGGEQSQASVEWGGHGEQRIGDDPEAECHPARDQGSAP